MTDSAATDYAMTDAQAGAMAVPTSEVVVAAYGGDGMVDVLANAPTGDTNHLLCRGQDEPLSDFSRRLEWRLRTLRKKSSIRRVCYLLGPQAPHDWLPCRQVLGLLSSGAEFELVATPASSVDVVQTLDELMPYAPVGVRVSIRREDVRQFTNVDNVDSLDADRDDAANQSPAALPGIESTERSGVFYVGKSVV